MAEIDGKKTSPAKAKLVEKFENGDCKVELTIHEGRNHQVKKMFEAIGKTVAFLKRTEMGEIRLGGLSRGKWRYLNDKEVAYLKELNFSNDKTALVCGPPIMIKFVLAALEEMGFSKEQIYTTLELRMKQLETEQSALQNEMEAVKKVVSKNIENGFKTFGG